MKDFDMYVRRFPNVPGSTGSTGRRYKYAEGGVNLAMLPAGDSLSDGVRVLKVERAYTTPV